jgi:uracil-DNA glycosylase family 4
MLKLHKYFDEMDINIKWYKKNISINLPKITLTLEELENNVSSCTRCNLHKTRNKTVFGDGKICSDIMIIGEAPGKDEDEQGKPFVGRAGKLLNSFLRSIKLNRNSVFITNTIKCRPPDNRNPMNDEIRACSGFLKKQIDLIKPKVIVLLGKIAANSLLGEDKPMSDLRQKKFFINKSKIPIIVFYHPAYILRSPLKKTNVWQDLKFLDNILKENVS